MKKTLAIVLCFVFPLMLSAQPGGGGDPGGGEPVPIAGVELLLAAGALLGLKKIHSSLKFRKGRL
jgi:hypothetical protein